MSKRYILFVKETCGFCAKAEKLLQENDLPYKKVNFEQDQESVLTEIKTAMDYKTVPMVFERDGNEVRFVGGFSDLEQHLNNV